jgi:uncharacterized protein YkwD
MKLIKILATAVALTALLAATAMAALLESIGHRVNILDPNVNYVGVATFEGISPYNLYVQEFAHE